MSQLLLFPDSIMLEELFQAYFNCRRNKRSSTSALEFEADYEANLVCLLKEINDGSYEPGNSMAFIVDKPVKREIFAAAFRDRVVHHLVINKMNHLFEKEFIYDSYSCRIGKGTHLGIRRLDGFIRQCSQNHTRDCFILKLDIQGFFMHINRNILFNTLRNFLVATYFGADRDTLVELCRKIIHREPTRDCTIKGQRNAWAGLPQNKSLFHSPPDCGLPIGNLTSQVFANFYLNALDHYVKHDLAMRYYGRYVDDCVLVHESRTHLESLIPLLREFLRTELGLTLHPKKIVLEHYAKGVQFLGAFIRPGRIYIASRTKGNFHAAVTKQNRVAEDHKPNMLERKAFLSSMNSYLGILRHYRTWRLRNHILREHVSPRWWKLFRSTVVMKKVEVRIFRSQNY